MDYSSLDICHSLYFELWHTSETSDFQVSANLKERLSIMTTDAALINYMDLCCSLVRSIFVIFHCLLPILFSILHFIASITCCCSRSGVMVKQQILPANPQSCPSRYDNTFCLPCSLGCLNSLECK